MGFAKKMAGWMFMLQLLRGKSFPAANLKTGTGKNLILATFGTGKEILTELASKTCKGVP